MGSWQLAIITRINQVSEDMLSISLRPEHWSPHKAGQNYEVRIPGAKLMRKYSVVSPPFRVGELELGVQLLPYGAVSPKMWGLRVGEKLEIRGPFGTFTWESPVKGPIILIGGGSGITPLLGIYEQIQIQPHKEVVFIMSAKHAGRVMYYEKLKDHLITRFTSSDGRVDRTFLEKNISKYISNSNTRLYVCGPQGFADNVVDILLEMGFANGVIYSEGFS